MMSYTQSAQSIKINQDSKVKSKRKIESSHYDEDYFDSRNTENITRETTKKIKIVPDICDTCFYGKFNDRCRCSFNCDTITIDNINIKTCVFCTELVSVCNCSSMLWALYQCDTCKISHSIYHDCLKTTKQTVCEMCEKNNNYTVAGCRCMHQHIKYVLTDINLKKFIYNTDFYLNTFNKSEFQSVCTQCSQHITNCNCLKDMITDEYNIMKNSKQNEDYDNIDEYYNNIDENYDNIDENYDNIDENMDEDMNYIMDDNMDGIIGDMDEQSYEKDFREQMNCD